MSLVKCPECGSQVSSQSKKCVNCGYPINDYHQIQFKKTNSNKKLTVFLTVLVIIVAIILLLFKNQNSQIKNFTNKYKEDIIGNWISEYQEFNLLKLKPESELDVIFGMSGLTQYLSNGEYQDNGSIKLKFWSHSEDMSTVILNFNVYEEGTWDIKGKTLITETKDGQIKPADDHTSYLLNNTFSFLRDDFLDVGIGEKSEEEILSFEGKTMIIEHKMLEDIKVRYIQTKMNN